MAAQAPSPPESESSAIDRLSRFSLFGNTATRKIQSVVRKIVDRLNLRRKHSKRSAQQSVEQPGLDPSEPLVNLGVEGWRFSKAYIRAISKLDAGEQTRHASQVRYFLKQIEENLQKAGVTLVNLEGQPFDLGLPIKAVNLPDFTAGERLIVEQMIEPVVMGRNGLLRMGVALLKRDES